MAAPEAGPTGRVGIRVLRRLATRPESWLALLAAGVFARFWALGQLAPRLSNDAQSYEWPWQLMSFSDALQHVRTLGYPLFLRVWSLFADDYAALPTVHLLSYLLAVALFWRALASYSGSPWLSFAAAVPLLTSSLLPLFSFVQPDLMAPTVAIATAALLVWLVLHPASKLLWIAVGTATLATYHLRPVYVGLAIVVPATGLALRFALESDRRRLRRFGLGLVVACLVPLFAYCGLRWAVVGHFGIVNFEGYELAGIAANFLDRETVAALPEEHRELGRQVLKWRERRGWTAYTRDSVSYPYFRQYGRNQWYIAEPLARRLLMRHRLAYRAAHGEDALPISALEAWQIENPDRPPLGGDLARAINDNFESFAMALIRLKPHLYLKWVRDSVGYGLARIIRDPWVRWPALALVATLPLLLLARRRSAPGAGAGRPAPGSLAAVLALGLLGASLFLGTLILISLVSWPWDRYLFGAALFLPPALAAALFAAWADLLRRLSGHRRTYAATT